MDELLSIFLIYKTIKEYDKFHITTDFKIAG